MIDWSTETRDLGIVLDSKLTFTMHILLIAHKAHIRDKLILKSFLSRDPEILRKAFITYVRPLLEYCTPIWSPHTQHKVESVQRQFTKRIDNMSDFTYAERLQILGLKSLQVHVSNVI